MSHQSTELDQILVFLHRCPAGVVRMRRDGRIDLANPAACDLLLPISGTTDLSNLYDILEPVAPHLRDSVLRFKGETGVIVDRVQIRLPGPDDEPCFVEISIIAVGGGTCVAMMEDVTRLVAHERLMQVQEQRLRAITDSLHDSAVYTLDQHGRMDSWNRSIDRLTGLEPDDVLGQPFDALATAEPTFALPDVLATARRAEWVTCAFSHRRAPDEEFWAEAVISSILGPDGGMTGYTVVLRDATAKHRYEEELVRLSTQDPLTGALNRRAFFDAADREATRSRRHGRDRAILMIDVDHFRVLNDTYGRDAADRVLRTVVAAITQATRPTDLVGRLDGDEIAVLAPDTTLADAAALGEQLREAVATADILVPGGRLHATVSVGVAVVPASSGESFESAYHRAEEALAVAKRAGRDRISVGRLSGESSGRPPSETSVRLAGEMKRAG